MSFFFCAKLLFHKFLHVHKTCANNLKSKVIKPARMLNLRTGGIVLSCRDAYMMEAGAGVPKWLACKGQHASIRAGSAIRSGIGVLTFLEAQQCLLHNGASCIATVMMTIAFWHTLSTISDHARTNIARCCDDRKYCAPRCIGNLPRAILMTRTVRPQPRKEAASQPTNQDRKQPTSLPNHPLAFPPLPFPTAPPTTDHQPFN